MLQRLGARLSAAVDGSGTAYRMGGDEFCILTPVPDNADQLRAWAPRHCPTRGSASWWAGPTAQPSSPPKQSDCSNALTLVDHRLYANKVSGRVPASRQSADVLLTLLNERNTDLGRHCGNVAARAEATAIGLGLPEHEVERIRLAAQLPDIGKAADRRQTRPARRRGVGLRPPPHRHRRTHRARGPVAGAHC